MCHLIIASRLPWKLVIFNDVTATWFPWKMMSRQHDFREKLCHGNIISVKNDVKVTWFPSKMMSRQHDFHEKDVKASWFLWKMMSQQQHDFLQFLLDKPFSHNPLLLIKTLSKTVLSVYTRIEHIIAVNTMYWTCRCRKYRYNWTFHCRKYMYWTC